MGILDVDENGAQLAPLTEDELQALKDLKAEQDRIESYEEEDKKSEKNRNRRLRKEREARLRETWGQELASRPSQKQIRTAAKAAKKGKNRRYR